MSADPSNDTIEIQGGTGEWVTFKPRLAYQTQLLREQDGKPQRVFFYRNRNSGRIIPFMEQEAAMQMKGSHRHILEQIGCSDMSAYRKVIAECGLKPDEVVPKEKAQEILNRAMEAEIQAATGHFDTPMDNSVHYIDDSIPQAMRSTLSLPKN